MEQREEIGGADKGDACGVEIGGECEAGESRIAAVGPTHDSYALRIRDSLGDEIADAVGDVVLHLLAPLIVAGVQEFLSVTGGGSEVWLKYRVATVGEELRDRRIAPRIASPRPAVNVDNHRKIFWRYADGQSEIGGDGQTIGRLVRDGFLLGQRLARELVEDLVEESQLVGVAVEQPTLARLAIAVGHDHPLAFVAGHGRDADLFSGKLALEEVVILLPRRILPVRASAVI